MDMFAWCFSAFAYADNVNKQKIYFSKEMRMNVIGDGENDEAFGEQISKLRK
jgi:hypothetical protein